MAQKREDARTGDLRLVTNVYGINTKHVPVYRYEISVYGGVIGRDGSERATELTGPVIL